jgi:hypothetical protein
MRCRWNCCLVAWAGLALVGSLAAQTQVPSEGAGAPRLELSTQEWNFGVAWQGQPVKLEITVKNVGTAPLDITDVSSSCGCTVPTKPKSPLAPGESSTLTISYDSARRLGPASQTVTLVTNDATQPKAIIKLSGDVKPVYDLDPKEGLVFGQLNRHSNETRTVTITDKYTEPLRLELKEDQDFGPFAVQLQELEPGARYALLATTKPPLKVERYQALILLRTNLELVPEIRVQLYGFVQPPAVVRPAKLFLPRNSVSDMKRVLQLSYVSDYPLELTGAKATHDAIKVAAQKVPPGPDGKPVDAYQITVTLPPGEMIPEDAEPAIEITTNAPDPEYQRFVVPIQMVPAPTTQPALPSATGTPGGNPSTQPAQPAGKP